MSHSDDDKKLLKSSDFRITRVRVIFPKPGLRVIQITDFDQKFDVLWESDIRRSIRTKISYLDRPEIRSSQNYLHQNYMISKDVIYRIFYLSVVWNMADPNYSILCRIQCMLSITAISYFRSQMVNLQLRSIVPFKMSSPSCCHFLWRTWRDRLTDGLSTFPLRTFRLFVPLIKEKVLEMPSNAFRRYRDRRLNNM